MEMLLNVEVEFTVFSHDKLLKKVWKSRRPRREKWIKRLDFWEEKSWLGWPKSTVSKRDEKNVFYTCFPERKPPIAALATNRRRWWVIFRVGGRGERACPSQSNLFICSRSPQSPLYMYRSPAHSTWTRDGGSTTDRWYPGYGGGVGGSLLKGE